MWSDQFQHLLLHCRIVAAQYGGSAGLEKVDVPVAILVVKVGSFCPVKYNGERVVKGQVVLNASRDVFFCLFDNRF